MTNRKQIIEEILNSFHTTVRNMKAGIIDSGSQNLITHSQWFVLCIIENSKGTSIKDISKILKMSSSAATQLVDGLVKNNYVVRQDNPNDRRTVLLGLSSKGKKQIKAMKKKRINTLAKLFDALNDRELATYLKLHKKISSQFLNNVRK